MNADTRADCQKSEKCWQIIAPERSGAAFLFQETAQDSKNGKDNNPDLPYTEFTRQGGEESGKHRIYIEG